MPSRTGRRLTAAAAACALTLLAACGTSSDAGDTTADGKVRLDVNGQPPTTQAFERELFDERVREFEEANPDIDIVPHEGFMDPKTFSAKLAGGKLEDIFYVYFTDEIGRASCRESEEGATASERDSKNTSSTKER